MLNLGLSFVSFLGIGLAIAGVGLYFLRSIRPELARDQDIFFAAISLVCGLILLFQGWRLDPILAFSQYLLAGSAVYFAVENLRLRGVTTEQAKRNTPIVDRGRPVSREYNVYQEAELDEFGAIEDEESESRPRIRGSRDTRSSRNSAYEDEPRRRPSGRLSSAEREKLGSEERPRRRSRTETRTEPTDEWAEPEDNSSYEERPPRRSRTRPPRSEENSEPETTSSRPRRRRSEEAVSRRNREEVEATPTDYVDYQPIKSTNEEDNSGNFDY
jgi:Ycf66 protein N-terminus